MGFWGVCLPFVEAENKTSIGHNQANTLIKTNRLIFSDPLITLMISSQLMQKFIHQQRVPSFLKAKLATTMRP